MNQTALNIVLGILVTVTLALSGWALSEITQLGRTDAAQAEATLSLKSATGALLTGMQNQEQKLSRALIEVAVLKEQLTALRRDVDRNENRE